MSNLNIDKTFQSFMTKRYDVDFSNMKESKSLYEQVNDAARMDKVKIKKNVTLVESKECPDDYDTTEPVEEGWFKDTLNKAQTMVGQGKKFKVIDADKQPRFFDNETQAKKFASELERWSGKRVPVEYADNADIRKTNRANEEQMKLYKSTMPKNKNSAAYKKWAASNPQLAGAQQSAQWQQANEELEECGNVNQPYTDNITETVEKQEITPEEFNALFGVEDDKTDDYNEM